MASSKGSRGGKRATNVDPFAEKYGAYWAQMNAIEQYVGSNDVTSDSKKINRTLANSKLFGVDAGSLDTRTGETIRSMDKAMNISPLEKNMTLYSGSDMSYYQNAKVGDIIDMNGVFISTSESKSVAQKYVAQGNGVMLEIKAKKGTPSINVKEALKSKNNWNAQNEAERILSRKLKYKVVGKSDSTIKLEVVN